MEGEEITLAAIVIPSNATNKNIIWNSSDSSIASVNQGVITANQEGTTTITATSEDGNKSATCEVTILRLVEYIDEYGINHGRGIKIDETIWAPVNCGYHAEDFKYGKLYQWGRKYGQGYDGALYDSNGNYIEDCFDKVLPETKDGRVSLTEGQSQSYSNTIFNCIQYSDWLYIQNNNLWNSGTEENPIKTKYDPCPNGWRVPTLNELETLTYHTSEWTTNPEGQPGYYYSGSKTYDIDIPQIFFPAAGYRGGDACAFNRGLYGYYWSSKPSNTSAYYLMLYKYRTAKIDNFFAQQMGYSIRCVHK